jgi:hypothetical protein
MKIAISLLCHNDEDYLKPCLKSLFESDLNGHNIKLFCYDNNSNKPMKDYLNTLNINKWVFSSEKNEGIVIPRIKIYNEIIKEEFDFLLEIHSDMIFPKIWLKPLLDIFDSETGILEPHIYQPKKIISKDDFELILPRLLNGNVYTKCRQTHPWLINLKIVNNIGGYYDPKFSPHECEDDDFIYRVIKNGYKVKSVGSSWVVHYGGAIRHKLLGSVFIAHSKYFEEKHKITLQQLINMFEIHPAYGE